MKTEKEDRRGLKSAMINQARDLNLLLNFPRLYILAALGKKALIYHRSKCHSILDQKLDRYGFRQIFAWRHQKSLYRA